MPATAGCVCVPAERDGFAYNPWLSHLTHSCVYSPRDTLAVLLGFLNICFWLVSQMPQMWENYQRGSVQGLSFSFLLGWCLADAAALLGCILTSQEAYMTGTAGYFVCSDVVLMGQFVFYYAREARARRAAGGKNTPLLYAAQRAAAVRDGRATPVTKFIE